MKYDLLLEELLQSGKQLARSDVFSRTENLAKGEAFVLGYLADHGDTASGDLCRAMHVSSARIAALLGILETKGLLLRGKDPEDLRRTRVTLTDEGIAKITQRRQMIRRKLYGMLEELGPEDAENFVRIVGRIARMACGS